MNEFQIQGLIEKGLAVTAALILLLSAGWALLSVLRRRMAQRHEIRRAVLEKLPNEEMVRLLETEGGRAWLRDVLAGQDETPAAIERGMQIVFAGIGCGIAAAILREKFLGALSIVVISAGLGQFAAAALLSRRARKPGDGR